MRRGVDREEDFGPGAGLDGGVELHRDEECEEGGVCLVRLGLERGYDLLCMTYCIISSW